MKSLNNLPCRPKLLAATLLAYAFLCAHLAYGQATQPAAPPAAVAPRGGMYGQNTTYCVDWEQFAWGLGDAAKASRAPEVRPDRVIWRIATKGHPSRAGVYRVLVPRRVESLSVINNPAAVTKVSAGEQLSEYHVDLKAPATQLTLVFPANTDTRGTKIYRPGYDPEKTGPWTQEFLDLMARYRGAVLRGMDGQRTNGSDVVEWADVGKPADERYGDEGRGMPPHLLVDLANRLDCDFWLNIPHMASDACVEEYARLGLGLRPGLRLIVEYSNEIGWNDKDSIGEQTRWLKERAQSVAGDPRFHPTNNVVRARQWYGMRLVQVGAICRRVYAEAGREHEVAPVLAGQAAYPEMNEWAADWIEKNVGPLKEHVAAVAVAPYFGSSDYVEQQPDGPLPVEWFYARGYEIRDAVKQNGKIVGWSEKRSAPGVYLRDAAVGWMRSAKGQRFFAFRQRGVQCWAYEGGMGIRGAKLKGGLSRAITAHPQAYEVMRTYFDEWQRQGGTLFCLFVPFSDNDDSTYGGVMDFSWGPKAQAIADASAARPWPYATPPGPLAPDPAALLATVTAERDALAKERDGLAAERDRFREQMLLAQEALHVDRLEWKRLVDEANARWEALKAKASEN